MNDIFVVENGILVKKLFVGPIYQAIKEKFRIADRDDRLENVSEVEKQAKHLKEQQILASVAIGKTEASTNKASSTDRVVIRRRRKFHYSNVDEILAKGYWKTEKRSYTKYGSNSLMFEYTQIRGKFTV